jgi:hypothetical protein
MKYGNPLPYTVEVRCPGAGKTRRYGLPKASRQAKRRKTETIKPRPEGRGFLRLKDLSDPADAPGFFSHRRRRAGIE